LVNHVAGLLSRLGLLSTRQEAGCFAVKISHVCGQHWALHGTGHFLSQTRSLELFCRSILHAQETLQSAALGPYSADAREKTGGQDHNFAPGSHSRIAWARVY
jgi:hypothetical protein